ncbi:MAG: pentapeptide repeat-containing protein [Prochlorococcaceae cyanobacterium]
MAAHHRAAGLAAAAALLGLGFEIGIGSLPAGAASPSGAAAVMRLLESRRCSRCQLADADLVHADLRDADLSGAALQRANLSRAQLDGARLTGADLSFTSLQGASLRGADLRGARLEGTDLREANLSGALFDSGALASAHWSRATGLSPEMQSYADLHNAGVEAANAGRFPEAETFFSEAIRKEPAAAISWVARGISRSEQSKTSLASQDLAYAAKLYEQQGDTAYAKQLQEASKKLDAPNKKGARGNGLGMQLVGGVMGALQFLAPLAAKSFLPVLAGF